MNAQNPFPAQATATGYQQIASTCGEIDQIQLFSGNLVKTITVVNVPTIGLPLAFVIYYNSLDTIGAPNPLGNKCRHNWMMNLSGNFTSQITLTTESGRQYGFVLSGSTWVPDGSSYFYPATLTASGSDWRITFYDTAYYLFSSTGVLLSQVDAFGNTTTLTYNGSGQLTTVTEPTGRPIRLTYYSTSPYLLETITDPNGNVTTLYYTDVTGTNLTELMKPNGCVNYYGWTLLSVYNQYMLTTRQDASGTYTYGYVNTSGAGNSGRLSSVIDAESPSHTISYVYNLPDTSTYECMDDTSPDNIHVNSTVLTDAFGSLWEYRFDDYGNLWRVIQPDLAAPTTTNRNSSHWRHYFWDTNQKLLQVAAGYPSTNSLGYCGPKESMNDMFRRYAYDNPSTGASQGLLMYECDATGILTSYTYDTYSNVASVYPGQANFGVQGNWIGQYGSLGYILPAASSSSTDIVELPSPFSSTYTVTTPSSTYVPLTYVNGPINNSAVPGDPRALMLPSATLPEPAGLNRGGGMWAATSNNASYTGSMTITLHLAVAQVQAFNISIYTTPVFFSTIYSSYSPMWEYQEHFGADLTFSITTLTDGTQSFRVPNNAQGAWVTFPIHLTASESSVVITVTGSGLNTGATSAAFVNALAIDPYYSRKTSYTYTYDRLTSITNPLGQTTLFTLNANGTTATMQEANGAVTTFSYGDAYQNLSQVTDALGNSVSMSYDLNGNRTSQTDANNHRWAFTFDGINRLTTQTDPVGFVTTWNYATINLTSFVDANGHTTSMQYTPTNRLKQITFPLTATVVSLQYDGAGNPIKYTDADNNATQFTYDALMRLSTVVRPDTNTSLYTYDALDRLRAITPPNGTTSVANINYTNAGNFLSNPGAQLVNPYGSTQAQGWVATPVSASNVRTTSEYHSGTASLQLAVTSSTAYAQGWQQSNVAVPPGVNTLFTFWGMTNSSTANDVTLGASLTAQQLNGGQVTTKATLNTIPAANTWTQATPTVFPIPGDAQFDRYTVGYTYTDSDIGTFTGAVTAYAWGAGSPNAWLTDLQLSSLSTAFVYDLEGRPVQVQTADGAVFTIRRDRYGRAITTVDARGQWVRVAYDGLDRPTTITDQFGNISTYGYDTVNNLVLFQPPLLYGSTMYKISYTYDFLHRLTEISYIVSGGTTTEQFVYDRASNLIQYTNPNAQIRTLAYDALNRLTYVFYQSNSTSVSLCYDPVGNLMQRVERNGDILTYVYDANDRLINVQRSPSAGFTGGADNWLEVSKYDNQGNRTELDAILPSTYPDYGGSGITYGGTGVNFPAPTAQWQPPSSGSQFNTLNQLLAFRDRLGNATTLGYDSVESRLKSISFPNSVATALGYDILGHVISMLTTHSSTTLVSLAYGYDLNSNRTGLATATDRFDWGMDTGNRLAQETINQFTQRTPDRFATGTGTGVDIFSGQVTLLPFADTLTGQITPAPTYQGTVDLDRWRPAYFSTVSGFEATTTCDLGFEIRQDTISGLNFVFPRGFTNYTVAINSFAQIYPYLPYGLNGSVEFWAGCEHRMTLSGNFDVQVDFSNANAGGSTTGPELMVADTPLESAALRPTNAVELRVAQNYYYIYLTVSGTTNTYQYSGANNTSGGLRIARSGSNVTCYTLVSGVWTALGSPLTFVNTTMYMSLLARSAARPVSGSFSNLVINTGNAYAPSGTYTSSIYDAGQSVTWAQPVVTSTVPTGTSLTVNVGVSNSPDPGSFTYAAWSSGLTGRYASYQAVFTSNSTNTATPILEEVDWPHSGTLSSSLRTYSYDADSNMTGRVIATAGSTTITETRTYNTLDQITANSVVGSTTTNWSYTWDSNGNMKTRVNTTLSQTTTYNWDDDNRLLSVVLPSGETITYTYDILGRMISRNDSSTGNTTYFVWDGMIPIQETTGTTVTNYYAPQGLLLSFDQTVSGTTTTYQVSSDVLGSVVLITTSTGSVESSFEYGAWGDQLAVTDPLNFPYRFVGGYGVRWDSVTGLYYCRNRWYDPTLQRFISRDVLGADNRYAYCFNNPTAFVDTNGQWPQWQTYNIPASQPVKSFKAAVALLGSSGGFLICTSYLRNPRTHKFMHMGGDPTQPLVRHPFFVFGSAPDEIFALKHETGTNLAKVMGGPYNEDTADYDAFADSSLKVWCQKWCGKGAPTPQDIYLQILIDSGNSDINGERPYIPGKYNSITWVHDIMEGATQGMIDWQTFGPPVPEP